MRGDWETFEYFESTGTLDRAIFLFHGTGGSQQDLLPFVSQFQNSHHLVSLLGNVREGQMARFFARFADGSFDLDSLKSELNQLVKFVAGWHERAGLDQNKTIYVGYSNGANFLLAFLLNFPHLIRRAVLMHPMAPVPPDIQPDLRDYQILVSWSQNDEMIPASQSRGVLSLLGELGAEVESVETGRGHQVDRAEVLALNEFIKRHGGEGS